VPTLAAVFKKARLDRIVELIAERGQVSVVGLNAALAVSEATVRRDIELFVIGGVFRRTERPMVSQLAERMIAEFRVETALMGVRAIDAVAVAPLSDVDAIVTDEIEDELAAAIMANRPNVVVAAGGN
jgi:DeoR/GlpR family transcriptional regulator of sugar metabolism